MAGKRIYEGEGFIIMKRQREDHLRSDFVPANATISELEKQASECEQKAAKEKEAVAQELRKKAKLFREWIAALRSGRWTP